MDFVCKKYFKDTAIVFQEKMIKTMNTDTSTSSVYVTRMLRLNTDKKISGYQFDQCHLCST